MFVYLASFANKPNLIKIGVSKYPKVRMYQLVPYHGSVKYIHTFRIGRAYKQVEKQLHKLFANQQVIQPRGEDGRTEFFSETVKIEAQAILSAHEEATAADEILYPARREYVAFPKGVSTYYPSPLVIVLEEMYFSTEDDETRLNISVLICMLICKSPVDAESLQNWKNVYSNGYVDFCFSCNGYSGFFDPDIICRLVEVAKEKATHPEE